MSGTPNLNVTHVVQSQSQKEVTINSALDDLDRSANTVATISLAGNAVLTAAQFNKAGTLRFTNGGIAAPATVTLPANHRQVAVDNRSGQTLTLKHAGAGATISVAHGEVIRIVCDGVDVVGVGAASGTGISAIGDLSDVDTATTAPQTGDRLEWNGTKWAPSAPEFVAMSYLPGKPSAAQTVLKAVAGANDAKFTLPSGLADSRAHASTAPSASAAYSIKKNGVQVGTVTFAAGSQVGTFAMASDTAFAAGDVMEIVAPVAQDAALSDVAITLSGTRR